MPFVQPPVSPTPRLTTSSLLPNPPDLPKIPITMSQSLSLPSLPPATSSKREENALLTVSQKMLEISKERAAKRKREREARERRLQEVHGSWSGSGSSMNISSAESSLDSSLGSKTSDLSTENSSSSKASHSENRSTRIIDSEAISTSLPFRQVPPCPIPQSAHHDIGIHMMKEPGVESAKEGDDDDADLKRLMDQAENMLKISDNDDLQNGPQSAPHIVGTSHIDDTGGMGNEALSGVVDERRQKAIKYLEGLFMGLLDDLERSTRILNDREIEKGCGKSKGPKLVLQPERRKRKLDHGDDVSSEEERAGSGDEQGITARTGKVGIELRLRNRTTGEDQVLTYPDEPLARKESALHRLTQRFRVAELLYEAVLTGCVTTKRDIYYKDVQMFRSQYVVDKIVDDMVASAGLKRQDFNVCAASKGLVASACLSIQLKSGGGLSLSATNASLIPPIERIGRINAEGGVNWVLIVEKDAVFQTLLSLKVLDQPNLSAGVLITGKGYPDLATIQLCHLISKNYPSAKFHALVDADPHGIDIMQVYTKGSRSTKHSRDHAGLALGTRLEWMGVKASEWLTLGVKHDQLLELSERDVEKAMAMLRRPDISIGCRRELQHMLHLDRKAEIQILSSIREEDTLESIYMGDHTPGLVKVSGLLVYVMERLKGGIIVV